MIRIEKTETYGWDAAIRGMRNPMNSRKMSDSGYCHTDLLRDCTTCAHHGDTKYSACETQYDIGIKDHNLMVSLAKNGPVHAKYRRMIAVYCDIMAPLYWWKEFDTYKVGTVANSCSTMHKIAAKPFTIDDFSIEHLMSDTDDNNCPMLQDPNDMDNAFNPQNIFMLTLRMLNACRDKYLKEKTKDIWWQMIQLLPSSYNQKRTVMLNYEVLANIYQSRKHHKLDEWRKFCEWIENLPYSELITGTQKEEESDEISQHND